MCTVVVAAGLWPGVPLAVTANRDESLARPSEGPRVREIGGTRVFAPLDLEAGGTWWGLAQSGMFAILTNRFDGRGPEPGRRSRGLVVADALAAGNVDAAARRIAREDAARHNPFHLILLERDRAELVWNDRRQLHRRRLEAGLHVVTERSLDAYPTERPERVRRYLAPFVDGAFPGLRPLRGVLAERDPTRPMESVAVSLPERSYGTISSMQGVWETAGSPQLYFADGPPPDTPYAPLGPEVASFLTR